ncbi:MAG: serine/threonine-protein kinase [Candidatus Obscuribacterales bacterium]|jgi:serine/threonine protein kinase
MITKRSKTSVRLAQRRQLTNSTNRNSNGSAEGPSELAAGSVIGGTFRILQRIGEGGMGVVYLAQHQGLGRQYALKVLSPEAVNEQNWLRFQSEAKILARLNHPTLVQVYDLGLHEKSVPFYSMDYLVGSTLEELLAKKGSLPLDFTLEVFLTLLDGLSYAHSNNIIHRDIKPANIFICASTERTNNKKLDVKILDFGISKLVGADSKAQHLTAVGEVFGSPFYMSPEQCRGDKVDVRSDIYSVGCSLFEALSGFVPFEGRTSLDISLMHEEAEPPLIADVVSEPLAADLPASIDNVIARCLAKNPEHRYQTAGELALDLQRVREGRSVAPPAVASPAHNKSKRSNHLPILLSLSTASILLGCTGLYVYLDSRYKAFQPQHVAPVQTKTAVKTNVHNERPLAALYADAEHGGEDLTPEDTKSIKAYLASDPGFYSKVVVGPVGKGRLYTFPSSFSLGLLTFVDKRGRNIALDAQGTVKVLAGTALRFTVGEPVKAFPDLLRYFRPDDLHTIFFDDIAPFNRLLRPNIIRLTGLRHAGFTRCRLQSEDIEGLNNLPKLFSLDLRHCHIDGQVLAKQKFLKQLTALKLDGVKDVSSVLKVVKEAKIIKVLALADNQLSSGDIANIASMSQLLDLTLVNCSLSNYELEQLTGLEKIGRLNLDQCTRLDQACLNSLVKFKNLEVLILPDDLLTDQNEKFLAQHLPRIRQFK